MLGAILSCSYLSLEILQFFSKVEREDVLQELGHTSNDGLAILISIDELLELATDPGKFKIYKQKFHSENGHITETHYDRVAEHRHVFCHCSAEQDQQEGPHSGLIPLLGISTDERKWCGLVAVHKALIQVQHGIPDSTKYSACVTIGLQRSTFDDVF